MKQGWERKKLGEVCEVVGGSTPKTNEESYWGGEHYWISPAELNGSKYVYSTLRTITDAGVKSAHLQLLPIGTVLLSSRAPIGKVAITKVPMYCNQGFKNLICTARVINEYIYWFLAYSTDYLNSLGTGATFKEISKKIVEQIDIPVPPLSIQERIVEELDCISGIIEKKKEQLKELDALAQSIFYTMFGDPVENDKGWEVKKLGEVCVLKSGDSSANNTSMGTLPYVKVGDMNMEENNPYITTSSTFVSREENIKGIFPVGTTIFPKRGGAIYTNKKRLTTVEICCDLNIMGVIPLPEVLPLYIYHYFVSLDFSKLCNGATIPQINNKDIAPLYICFPPIGVQQEFAKKIEAIEKQKELIRKSIGEVETLLASRMQEYFE